MYPSNAVRLPISIPTIPPDSSRITLLAKVKDPSSVLTVFERGRTTVLLIRKSLAPKMLVFWQSLVWNWLLKLIMDGDTISPLSMPNEIGSASTTKLVSGSLSRNST